MTVLPRRSLVCAIAAMLVGCGDRQQAAPPVTSQPAAVQQQPDALKAAWVYGGPVADAGWNASHDLARKAVEAQIRSKVQSAFVENVHAGAHAENVIRDLAAKGNRIIFVTRPDFALQTSKVAAEFPDVKFEQIGGRAALDNLRRYGAKLYESAFLAGVIAGAMSKSNTLGFVGAFASPEGLRNLNAFTLGALSVNPRIRTRVVWIGAWFEPASEGAAAQRLIDGGADVLLQDTWSTAVLQMAEKNGRYAFGWNGDMSAFAPHAHLASSVVDWAPYYRQAIEAAFDGSWTSTSKTGTTGTAGVAEVRLIGMADAIAADTRARVAKLQDRLKDGSFTPFTGPLVDSHGRVRLAPAKVADADWLDKIDFYVKGVEGDVPARP